MPGTMHWVLKGVTCDGCYSRGRGVLLRGLALAQARLLYEVGQPVGCKQGHLVFTAFDGGEQALCGATQQAGD